MRRSPRQLSQLLACILTWALAMNPVVAAAAPVAQSTQPAATEPAANEPATETPAEGEAPAVAEATWSPKTVALLRFTGDGVDTLRESIKDELSARGHTVRALGIDLEAAAGKLKCKDAPASVSCLGKLGAWLGQKERTRADFIVSGKGTRGDNGLVTVEVLIFDVASGETIDDTRALLLPSDQVLPVVLPIAMTTRIDAAIAPMGPLSEEEQRIVAELDEPEKTPEELRAEQARIDEAMQGAGKKYLDEVGGDIELIDYDLKKDFKDFCRNGPRRKRESKDDPRDWSPSCKLGTFWGYWQPRAWGALVLTGIAAVATLSFYGAALAKNKSYKDARSKLNDYVGEGDPVNRPADVGPRYVDLASEVREQSSKMRRFAIYGDVALGATVLLGGVLGIIIYQDRTEAKRFLREEKQARAIDKGAHRIEDLRVGPMWSRDTRGVGVGFRF